MVESQKKAEKTIFPTASKSILPPRPAQQQRISLTEICSNSSNNFGLLFRKSHFHIKLHPKNV